MTLPASNPPSQFKKIIILKNLPFKPVLKECLLGGDRGCLYENKILQDGSLSTVRKTVSPLLLLKENGYAW